LFVPREIKMICLFIYSKRIRKVDQSWPKMRTGVVQNSCITLLKGFDPLQGPEWTLQVKKSMTFCQAFTHHHSSGLIIFGL